MIRLSTLIRPGNSTSRSTATISRPTLLLLVEFAYNNALSVTTTVTPFYANKGYHPNLTIHPEQELASSHAKEFVTDLNKLHQHLQEHMAVAQLQYQGTADTSRTLAPEFPIGSRDYVKAQFFRTTRQYKRLADKFLGPYEVIAQLGTHSVTRCLPDSLRAIHPMFHVLMLEPATLNAIPDQVQPLPPPVFVDSEPEFEIAKVLDLKIDHWCSKCKLLYLVHWTGYVGTDKEMSWILASELRNAPELISDFHLSYPAKQGPLRQLWNHMVETLPAVGRHDGDKPLEKLRCHTFLISHSIIFYLR